MQTSGVQFWKWRRIGFWMRRGIRGDSGQDLVELALATPILLLLLLGAAEFARLAYAAIEVESAAKAGIQYGSQSATTASDTEGVQTAASNGAPDITLNPTTVTISCICSNGSASTCLRTDCATSHIEEILKVQTQATFDPLIYAPGLPKSFTLHGQATQKVLE
jgi:Flp pilus assembly protein TadG